MQKFKLKRGKSEWFIETLAENIRDIAATFQSTEDLDDIEIYVKKGKNWNYHDIIIRDTTCDDIISCPECGNEMEIGENGYFCPGCDFIDDLGEFNE